MVLFVDERKQGMGSQLVGGFHPLCQQLELLVSRVWRRQSRSFSVGLDVRWKAWFADRTASVKFTTDCCCLQDSGEGGPCDPLLWKSRRTIKSLLKGARLYFFLTCPCALLSNQILRIIQYLDSCPVGLVVS